MINKVRVTITKQETLNWRIRVVGGPHWQGGDEPVFVGAHPTREDAVAHVNHMGWEIAE